MKLWAVISITVFATVAGILANETTPNTELICTSENANCSLGSHTHEETSSLGNNNGTNKTESINNATKSVEQDVTENSINSSDGNAEAEGLHSEKIIDDYYPEMDEVDAGIPGGSNDTKSVTSNTTAADAEPKTDESQQMALLTASTTTGPDASLEDDSLKSLTDANTTTTEATPNATAPTLNAANPVMRMAAMLDTTSDDDNITASGTVGSDEEGDTMNEKGNMTITGAVDSDTADAIVPKLEEPAIFDSDSAVNETVSSPEDNIGEEQNMMQKKTEDGDEGLQRLDLGGGDVPAEEDVNDDETKIDDVQNRDIMRASAAGSVSAVDSALIGVILAVLVLIAVFFIVKKNWPRIRRGMRRGGTRQENQPPQPEEVPLNKVSIN